MKSKLILLIALFLNLSLLAQTFISQKQSFFGEIGEGTTKKERKVIIDGEKFLIILPDSTEFKGILKFDSEKIINNFTQKVYKIDGGGIIVLNEDNVFANLYGTKYKSAITYYLDNFIEPTDEEKLREKLESDKKIAEDLFKIDVEIFGEITAKCIQDKKVRPGMKEVAIIPILGKPKSINKTETSNNISKQYVYENKFIYTKNGIVTTIQSEE